MEAALGYFGLVVLGAGVGVVSAALGIGGGILMVPAFTTFIPAMDINTAKGSSLFVIMFVAAYNSWQMNRDDMKSPWDVVGLIALGSITGGYLGAWFTAQMSEEAVTWMFIALLAFAGFRTFFLKPTTVREEEVRKRRVLSVMIGLAAGLVGGGTGTGGGAVLVPFALWAGIASNARVVAMSNTVMIATAAAGALGHLAGERSYEMPYTYGQVNVALAPFVFLGAIVASPAGRWLNAQLSLERRRVVMGVLLVIIAARLAYRVLS